MESVFGIDDEKSVKKNDTAKKEDFPENMKDIFENSPDGTLICNESGAVIYANNAFRKMFSPDESTDVSDYLEILDVRGFPKNKYNISDFFLQDSAQQAELKINSKNRSSGDFIVTKFGFRKNKYFSGSMIFFKDLTENLRFERKLEKGIKFETLASFTGMIIHEYNNIFHVISGYGEMIIDSVSPETESFLFAEQVLKAVKRGSRMNEKILSFLHNKDGRICAVNIEPIVKETVNYLRLKISSSISVEHKISDKIHRVCATPLKIQLILINLASNSLKAMSETGGKLVIGVEPADENEIRSLIRVSDKNKYIKLFVEDTGKGLEKNELEQILNPFFKNRANTGAAGIGLSTVYGIVKKLNGKANFRSKPGKGSVFEVFIPCVQEESIKQISAVSADKPELKGNIFLVDDDENIIKVVSLMIKKLGYNCFAFNDSRDALSNFKAHYDKYDLVITDLAMPHIRGDEFAAEISRIDPALPVIFFTGYSEKEKKDMNINGIKKYLKKPVTKEVLGQTIKSCLEP